MSEQPEKYQVPKPGNVDIGHSAGRAVVSCIPFVGSAAVEFFNNVVTPPIERRRMEWMEEIATAVRELVAQGKITEEKLQENDAFISTLMDATQSAVKTHQVEKRKALRNAVLNAALPGNPDDVRRSIFLSMVDRFTPEHMSVLTLLTHPDRWYSQRGSPTPSPLELDNDPPEVRVKKAIPDLAADPSLIEVILNDLDSCKLIDMRRGMVRVKPGKAATPLGAEFLTFISDPLSDQCSPPPAG